MIDNQFDNFLNDKLKDHSAPVPAGLWDKVKDTQLDQFIGEKFKDHIAPVPSDLWEKVSDSQFDGFLHEKLIAHVAPVPDNIWGSIQDTQFDDFFASKLKDHTASIPVGLWEKIMPKEEDDRKGFFFFRFPAAALILLTLLLCGTLGGYLFLQKSSTDLLESEKNNTNVQIQKNKENFHPLPNPEKGETTQSPTVKENEHSNILFEQPKTKPSPSKEIEDPSTSVTQNVNKNIEINTLPNAEKTKSASLDQSTEKTVLSSNTNNLTNKKEPSYIQPNQANEKSGIPVYKDPFVRGDDNKNTNNGIGLTENAIDFSIPYQSNLLPAFTIPTEGNKYTGMQSLLNKQLANNNHTSKFRNVVICPADYKNRNTDWYLEPYFSPDYAFKTVTNNTASQTFLLKKDSSESMQIGYSAGIRLVKPITENILLKAGMQYSQINEKYVYRTENEVKTTTVVSVRTIIRAPGDTVIVRDTSIVLQIGYRNNTVYNHFRSFDIPFTVGYQFGNEDLKIGINAGVIFNLSTWQEGVILDSSLATVPLVKGGAANVYKSNLGLGIYGGISIVKKLSDDLHIFAEPYIRYNLSNMTNAQSPYNQKVNVGGLSLGLRFNLNRK